MSIYLRIPDISGSVTAAGYRNCIELEGITFGAGRAVDNQLGATDRTWWPASACEMKAIKRVDCSSPALFRQACVGELFDRITIDLCNSSGSGQPSPMMQYMLYNALITGYQFHADSGKQPFETLDINFSGLEQLYTPYSAKHEMGTRVVGYAAVQTKASLHKQLCLTITAPDPSPDGFNLFVATVYGEMGGVHHARDAVWKGVGSVIVNRVKTGLWQHYKTVAEVIAHTGFDAYANVCGLDWNHLNLKDYYVSHHLQFLKAWAWLNKQTMNYRPAMTSPETKVLDLIQSDLHDIYYWHRVITHANYYYSPHSMFGRTPGFLKIKNPERYRVYILGVNDNDVKFYYIPARVEREAGAHRCK